jgi:O-6-methylguanine DNA methyltransferase
MTYYTHLDTPVGKVLLTGDGTTLNAIYWDVYKHTPAPAADWIEDEAQFEHVIAQLDDYFTRKRTDFDVTFLASGTPFQKRVWNELSKIGFGETRTYQQIADAIGSPTAVRAVASAIGRNPLSIVVPCHRVLGSNGKLTGFAGGIESKRMLLQLEGAL